MANDFCILPSAEEVAGFNLGTRCRGNHVMSLGDLALVQKKEI